MPEDFRPSASVPQPSDVVAVRDSMPLEKFDRLLREACGKGETSFTGIAAKAATTNEPAGIEIQAPKTEGNANTERSVFSSPQQTPNPWTTEHSLTELMPYPRTPFGNLHSILRCGHPMRQDPHSRQPSYRSSRRSGRTPDGTLYIVRLPSPQSNPVRRFMTVLSLSGSSPQILGRYSFSVTR